MRNGKATRPASKIGLPDSPLQLAQPTGLHRHGTRTRRGGLRPRRTRRVSAAVPAVKYNKRSEGPFGLTSLPKATATLRLNSTVCMAFHAKEADPILSRSGTARTFSKLPLKKRKVRRGDLSGYRRLCVCPGVENFDLELRVGPDKYVGGWGTAGRHIAEGCCEDGRTQLRRRRGRPVQMRLPDGCGRRRPPLSGSRRGLPKGKVSFFSAILAIGMEAERRSSL